MGYLIPAGSADAKGTLVPSTRPGVAYDPSEGGGTLQFGPLDTGIPTPQWLERGLAGMGKSFADTGTGAQQRTLEYLQGLYGGEAAAPAWLKDRVAALRAGVAETNARDEPLMNTGAGLAGNILGQVAQTAAIPIGGAATAAGRLAVGAATGAAQGAAQPTAPGQSATANTLLGLALGGAGQGAANLVGRAVRGTQAATPEIQRAVDFIRAQGGDATLGQLTGHELTQRVESWLAKLPGSRTWYRNLSATNRDAVDRTIGSMTMEGEAGSAIQRAGQGRMFTSDAPFVADLQNLPNQFKMLPGGLKPSGALDTAAAYAGGAGPGQAVVGGRALPMTPQLQAAYEAAGIAPKALLPEGAQIPMVGPQGDFNNYQAIRSMLSKAAFKGEQGSANSEAYQAMRDAFDYAAGRSLEAQGAPKDLIENARNAYQIEKLFGGSASTIADDSVTYSLQKAANSIDNAFKKGTIQNLPPETQSTLFDLLNYARSVKPVSSSGTAENQLAGGLATGAGIGSLLGPGGLSAALSSIAPIVGGTYVVPWAVNRGMQLAASGLPTVGRAADAIPGLGLTLQQLMSAAPTAYMLDKASQ